MDSIAASAPTSLPWSLRLPAWTRQATSEISETDAAFAAGCALKSLDDLIRADPLWLGCWRDRLALKSAVVAGRMLGHNEEEHALRRCHVIER